MKVLNPNESYTFLKIFELNVEVDDIVADFGYSLSRQRLNLPTINQQLERLGELKESIEEILPFVNLTISPQPLLLGVVTMGILWQFTKLDRTTKYLTQDVESYRVPEDIDPLVGILVQALLTS